MLGNGFDKKQISVVQQRLLAIGMTADAVSEALKKFGGVTSQNCDDALMFAYQSLMKSKFVFDLFFISSFSSKY